MIWKWCDTRPHGGPYDHHDGWDSDQVKQRFCHVNRIQTSFGKGLLKSQWERASFGNETRKWWHFGNNRGKATVIRVNQASLQQNQPYSLVRRNTRTHITCMNDVCKHHLLNTRFHWPSESWDEMRYKQSILHLSFLNSLATQARSF